MMKGSTIYIDALFMLGLFANFIKASDLLLRPHQQKWIQRKAEELTLWLDYSKPIKLFMKLISPIGLKVLLVILIFVSAILDTSSLISSRNLNSYHDYLLAIVVYILLYLALTRWIGPKIIHWLLAGESSSAFVKRFGLLTIISLATFVTLIIMIKSLDDLFSLDYVKDFVVVLLFPIMAFAYLILQLALLLLIAVIIFVALEIVMKLIRGLAWRIVEYNKGSFAAFILILTIALGVFDLYLRNKK